MEVITSGGQFSKDRFCLGCHSSFLWRHCCLFGYQSSGYGNKIISINAKMVENLVSLTRFAFFAQHSLSALHFRL